MDYSVYKISLDIHKPEAQDILYMKRLDASRAIHISLTENGRPYQITPDCSAVFTARKPDGNPIYNDCRIEGNVIIYDVTQQTVSCVGETGCEIRLFNNEGGLITSPRFSILVDYTIYNGEEIVESAPEFDALQDRIDKADKLYDKVNNAYENGEFKGEKGEQGEKGEKGDKGEQGIQGVQGEKGDNGADGAKGQDGADGISAMHSWNGTTLTITSASGTSSANLKGDKGDKGEDGVFSDELADEITLNTAARHTHENKEVLDKINISSHGNLEVDGWPYWSNKNGSVIESITVDETTGDITIRERFVPNTAIPPFETKIKQHYKTSEIDNDSGFVTEEYVTAAINGSLDEIEAMIDESGVLDE